MPTLSPFWVLDVYHLRLIADQNTLPICSPVCWLADRTQLFLVLLRRQIMGKWSAKVTLESAFDGDDLAGTAQQSIANVCQRTVMRLPLIFLEEVVAPSNAFLQGPVFTERALIRVSLQLYVVAMETACRHRRPLRNRR